MKTLLKSNVLVALLMAITVAVSIHAQAKPFGGVTVVRNSYDNCNPLTEACTNPGMSDVFYLRASGESSNAIQELKTPARLRHLLIRRSDFNFWAYQDLSQHYSLKVTRKPALPNDPFCTQPQPNSVMAGEATVLGFRTMKWIVESPSAHFEGFFAPNLGCTPLRELTNWKDKDGKVVSTSSKIAITVTEGPPPASAFLPPEGSIETAPIEIHRALAVKRLKATGVDDVTATARINARFSGPDADQLKHVNDAWLSAHH